MNNVFKTLQCVNCLSLECPSLSLSIQHGNVNGSGSVEGSLYTFSCNHGYSLVGEGNLQCTSEGKWNASIPKCLKGTQRPHLYIMAPHFI